MRLLRSMKNWRFYLIFRLELLTELWRVDINNRNGCWDGWWWEGGYMFRGCGEGGWIVVVGCYAPISLISENVKIEEIKCMFWRSRQENIEHLDLIFDWTSLSALKIDFNLLPYSSCVLGHIYALNHTHRHRKGLVMGL